MLSGCKSCVQIFLIIAIAHMLYARFSMRPSQSKFQYGWKPSILSCLIKNQISEIDRKLEIIE